MLKLIIGIVIGLIVGGIGGVTVSGGMMGVGVATGLSAGICATVQAAQEEGVMTSEQVDQVLRRAAADFGTDTSGIAAEDMVGSADQCDSFMDKLHAESGS